MYRPSQEGGKDKHTCVTCKKSFYGDPGVTNACGTFCKSCWSNMREKMSQSGGKFSKYKRMGESICIWCGIELDEDSKAGGKELVCAPCDKNRRWLLSCIRATPHAAKYVSGVEEREKKARDARIKNMEAAMKQNPATKEEEQGGDDRIDRLEKMMEKLVASLGGL